MKLTSLIFTDTFKIKADYGKMVTFFKSGVNERYFKGYIDRDETQLFYDSHLISSSFSPSIPIIQINFQNHVDKNGQIEIQFRIVTFALIIFGLVNGLILCLSIFRSGSLKALLASMFIFIFSYVLLLFFYRSALNSFKRGIESIVNRQ